MTDTGEVGLGFWYCESERQLDPEPQAYQKMSPPRGEHARENSRQRGSRYRRRV